MPKPPATLSEPLRAEYSAHSIPTLTGKYIVDGEEGECDIVMVTTKAVIFLEIKKKPLTRRAQAGSDVHVMLDLANSLLAAQVQAGWHEVRLRKHGYLELDDNGTKSRLEPIEFLFDGSAGVGIRIRAKRGRASKSPPVK